ncbi:hypothetical protein D3C77_394440 [compost metagenome]
MIHLLQISIEMQLKLLYRIHAVAAKLRIYDFGRFVVREVTKCTQGKYRNNEKNEQQLGAYTSDNSDPRQSSLQVTHHQYLLQASHVIRPNI